MPYGLLKSHNGSQQMILSFIFLPNIFGAKFKWRQRVVTNKFIFQVKNLFLDIYP